MLRDLFYSCLPDFLGGLYFRFDINLVPEKKYPIDIGGVRRICILASSGISDPTALIPMIRSLRHLIPEAMITIVVSPDRAEIMEGNNDLIDEIVVLDNKRKLKKIRNDWPDLTIDATNSGYVSAKIAYRTGSIYRLGFRYNHKGKENTGFMFTHTVPMDKSKNELEQGLYLIRQLGINPDSRGDNIPFRSAVRR